MTPTLQLQFSEQGYQTDAVDAVVKVFAGQALAASQFELTARQGSTFQAADGSLGNALQLSVDQWLANVQAVQASHFRDSEGNPDPSRQSPQLLGDEVPDPKGIAAGDPQATKWVPHFSIEMETGTGKSYVFIKTMYALNKEYGFKKFVVVVPSVAIREGAIKNLQITRDHFANAYRQVPCVYSVYDSTQMHRLSEFARSDVLSILVINIDSFAKDSNKINQRGEMPFAPIEYIRAVNPIVIVDEPQNFETDTRRQALLSLNPLCTLRYSATHRNPYNLLYSLDPVKAYDLGLVKQIEVDGVQAQANHNQAFVQLMRIEARARSMTATVLMDVNEKQGVRRKEVRLKVGDDLFEKSKGREVYQSGYVLNEFLGDDTVGFSGGRTLRLNEPSVDMRDDVMRYQIERTVLAHLAKMKRFKDAGLAIKVLSLFFIDKVANYRCYDDEGRASLGKFGVWFEEALAKCTAMPAYRGLLTHPAAKVHDGYFSGDKKGKGAQAKTIWVDSSEKGSAKDDSTYELIMRDKERLLGMDEPLQFIFSHSALREGWDNPNVFQICTLNESQSAMKKRQEIGRGLRLCVDQSGQRVMDKRVNVLTVIPNQSYEAFAQGLQQEIEDETGVRFEGRVKNARAKASLKRKALNAEEAALFQAIWDKINYQTRYSVELTTAELIDACVELLSDTRQYPRVQKPKLISEKAVLRIDKHGVEGVRMGVREAEAPSYNAAVPDVYVTKSHGVWMITDEGRAVLNAPYNGPAFLAEVNRRYQAWKATQLATPDSTPNALTLARHDEDVAPDDLDAPEPPGVRMATILRQANEALSAELLERIKAESPAFFERLVVQLLMAMGYGGNRANAGQVTQLSADNGIDGVINEDPLGLDTIYLQAKRWQDPVGEGPVRDFIGALVIKGVKKGVFLTTSHFTPAARAAVLANKSDQKIVLIDGARLAALMIEHNLGVSVAQSFALKRLDMDFFGEE